METEQAPLVYPASIIKALCNVMGECGVVKKSGKNKFHNYDYATDEDLVGMVRPLMAKHGLALIPSLAGMPQVESVQTKNGTASHVSIMMEYTLAAVSEDGKTGEVWPEKIRTFGEAIDNGDKGFYKASTGANKYTIFRLFQLAAGDDPERDSHEVTTGRSSQAKANKPSVTAGAGTSPPPTQESPSSANSEEVNQAFVDGIEEVIKAEAIHGYPMMMALVDKQLTAEWYPNAGNQATRRAIKTMVDALAAEYDPGPAPEAASEASAEEEGATA